MATTEIRTGSDAGGGSSAAPWIAFLVGIVLVAALVAGLVFIAGGGFTESRSVKVDVSAPKLPEITMPEAPTLPDAPRLPQG